MRMIRALSIAVSVLTVFIVVTVIYWRPLTTCNTSNCILLGSDTITQIHNYVKLKIPELWIPTANYGITPLNTLPGVIVYALLVKTLWYFTNGNMLLTMYSLIVLLLVIGSIGIYKLLEEIKIHSSGNILLATTASALVFTLNPGLWSNLYHGMITYLVSYSMCPWILVLARRTISDIIKHKTITIIIMRNIILLITILAISLTHPISSSLILLITLGYAIIYTFWAFWKNRSNTDGKNHLVTLNLIIVLVLSLILFIPFVLLIKEFMLGNSPSPSYITLIAETHRNVESIVSWHAILPIYSLSFNDNTVLQLGNLSIVYMLIFAIMISISIIYSCRRTIYRTEIITWLLLLLPFLMLSMGSRAPIPFNVINKLLYTYIPLIRIVGAPFRFAMISGFCTSILVGITTLTYAEPRKHLRHKFHFTITTSNKLNLPIYSVAIFVLILVFASIFLLQLSSLIITIRLPISYNDSASYIMSYGGECKYAYVIPSTEWIVPHKLTNASKIIKMFKGATVLPWPHNILGYVLSMNGVSETTGSYLRPYFEYVARYNLTDLMSVLMYYMGVRYIAIDGYVETTAPWLRDEASILTGQVGVKYSASFGDIKLYELNIGGGDVLSRGCMRVYSSYSIIATNILKLLPLALIDKNIINTYPIIVDEASLPYISELLDHAYFVLMDKAGFYDLVLAELIHMPNTRILNSFQLLNAGHCDGECRIEAMRLGWGYIGKPYYSLYDGNMLLEKRARYTLTLDMSEDESYVVLVRVLAEGHSGFVEVNGHREEITTGVTGIPFYEPTWFIFHINGSKIKISIEASKSIYLDCIAVTPLEEYYEAFNNVVSKLRRTTTYIALMPYNLHAESIKRVNMFGLGVIAQGTASLNNSIFPALGNEKELYVVGNSNITIISSLEPISVKTMFERYQVLYYNMSRSTERLNLSLLAPYTTGYNYVLLPNNEVMLKGFAGYLWSIPIKYFAKHHRYELLHLNFTIDPLNYSPGNAFGIALFHNTTYGYEVKFVLRSKSGNEAIYRVDLIKRINKKPIFLQSREIELKNGYHNVNVYVELRSRNVLVVIDNVPALFVHADKVYGNLFGVIQWGKNAKALIEGAQIQYPTTMYTASMRNIRLKGYQKILMPALQSEREEIDIVMDLQVLSTGKWSAVGLGLYHNGRHGLEIKVPIDRDNTIYRVELWKRINGNPYLINTTRLEKPLHLLYVHNRTSVHINIIRYKEEINIALELGNNSIKFAYDLTRFKNVGNHIALISWGRDTILIIKKFNIAHRYLNNSTSKQTLKLNLLNIKPNNGIAIIFAKNKPIKEHYNTDHILSVVLLQSYRPAWEISLPKNQNITLLYHIRGLYGLSNIYIVKTSSYPDAELLKNVKFYLVTKRYVVISLGLLAIYVSSWAAMMFSPLAKRKHRLKQ